MGSLANKSPKDTYKSLLKVSDETNGISTSVSPIEDGEGTASCVSISDDNLKIKPQNDNTTTTLEVENASLERSKNDLRTHPYNETESFSGHPFSTKKVVFTKFPEIISSKWFIEV